MGNVFDREGRGLQLPLLYDQQASAAARNQEGLDKEKNCPLNIAVTGEYGSGKSTFVNAIRGLDNTDEGAAPTGSVGTTEDVRPYPHPNYPNVTFWDLPGIGTGKYPAAEYLKLVGFERFDFFIIVSADRLRENDVKLAKEIQRMGKKFYFVRSKIDNNICDKGSRQREFDVERTLTQIRENCIQGLQEQGFESPMVFLVSSFELQLYDFPLLADTLERELPDLRRDAFLLAMPNTSLDMIYNKKKAFHSKVKYFAALSAAVAAVPVPGLSVAVTLILLVGLITGYIFGFGLDVSSLKRVANYTGVPFEELTAVITSPLAAKKVNPELVFKFSVLCVGVAALMAAEEGSRSIPVIGIPAVMVLSLTITYMALNIFLGKLADDALRVYEIALEFDATL